MAFVWVIEELLPSKLYPNMTLLQQQEECHLDQSEILDAEIKLDSTSILILIFKTKIFTVFFTGSPVVQL